MSFSDSAAVRFGHGFVSQGWNSVKDTVVSGAHLVNGTWHYATHPGEAVDAFVQGGEALYHGVTHPRDAYEALRRWQITAGDALGEDYARDPAEFWGRATFEGASLLAGGPVLKAAGKAGAAARVAWAARAAKATEEATEVGEAVHSVGEAMHGAGEAVEADTAASRTQVYTERHEPAPDYQARANRTRRNLMGERIQLTRCEATALEADLAHPATDANGLKIVGKEALHSHFKKEIEPLLKHTGKEVKLPEYMLSRRDGGLLASEVKNEREVDGAGVVAKFRNADRIVEAKYGQSRPLRRLNLYVRRGTDAFKDRSYSVRHGLLCQNGEPIKIGKLPIHVRELELSAPVPTPPGR